MSVIFSRAPLRISLGGGGTDLPSYYARARRLPRQRRDRQVRLPAHAHGLPAALPDEVLGDRGGRRPARDPPPDPARGAAAPLARQPAGDRLGRRRPRRHRHGLLGRLHRLPAQGAGAGPARRRSRPARWPRPPARSRSTCSASRSASRTSTSPRTAASARTRSTPTARVDVEPLELDARRRCASCATTSCSSTPARRARPRASSATRIERTQAADDDDGREPAPHEGDRAARAASCCVDGDLEAYAELMHEHWQNKRGRSPGMANEHIDTLYTLARRSRRARRQARRRRRRRLPARLRAAARGHAPGDGARPARRSWSSTSSSRAASASEYA